MKGVTVRSAAKLNLALDITGLTENGYHRMDMVMQSVDLYETVTLYPSGGISVRLPGSRVPANMHNTACKAAVAFFQQTGLLAGVDMIIEKQVPVRAGMAGGSADAAAVLAGLNRLYGAHLTLPQLCEIGALVGADVPFALTGGTARVGGIGEQITPLCPVPACCRFVVVMPGGGVSTPQAFARYDRLGTREHPDCDALQRAIEQGDYRAVCGAMGNALMYSSSAGRTNRRICSLLRRAGADAALMTGSGAAVFGVFDSDEHAEKAAALLRGAYRSVWVLRPCGAGTEILSEL